MRVDLSRDSFGSRYRRDVGKSEEVQEEEGKFGLSDGSENGDSSRNGDLNQGSGEVSEPGAPAHQKDSPAGFTVGPWTTSWVRDIAVSVMVSAFIIVFLYQPVRVEGTSMLPTLVNEDRLFINKIAYRVGDIHRGDVVVFLFPHDHSKSYIKRIIGVPGDDVRIDRGQVYVNGKYVKEDYVPLRYTDERSEPETIVGPHEYYVLGDHRSVASDSRDFGMVDRSLIYGKAAFVYWPMDQVGVVR